MAGDQDQRDLFRESSADDHAVVVNDRCLIRTHAGHRVVIVAGIVLAQYAVDDHMAEAHAMVSLVEQNWAQQTEVARAFRRAPRTLRRYRRRVETGGLAALGRPSGYPAGRPRLKFARLLLRDSRAVSAVMARLPLRCATSAWVSCAPTTSPVTATPDRKSTRLNSSHSRASRMPSSA